MTIAADVYKLLCQSLGVEGENNGQSVSLDDDLIVLIAPDKGQIPREDIIKVFEDYFESMDEDIVVESSPRCPALMYFLEGKRRDVIGGFCVVQIDCMITLFFLKELEAPEVEDSLTTSEVEV